MADQLLPREAEDRSTDNLHTSASPVEPEMDTTLSTTPTMDSPLSAPTSPIEPEVEPLTDEWATDWHHEALLRQATINRLTRERDTWRQRAEEAEECIATPVKMPRWDADPVVVKNGWNTPEKCGNCGEPNPHLAAALARLQVDSEPTEDDNATAYYECENCGPRWASDDGGTCTNCDGGRMVRFPSRPTPTPVEGDDER